MPLMRRGPGLVRGMARTAVVAGTATAVSGRVARRQQQRWAQQSGEATQQQSAAAPPPPAAPASGDVTSQLQELASMHASGALTDDEFEAAKARVLGG
jgi:putative oligomerization/nucleic acid binding protein